MNETTDPFARLLDELTTSPGDHATSSPVYLAQRERLSTFVGERFAGTSADHPHDFGPFGKLHLPYFEMGSITSLQLFGLDEIILFAFYYANRDRYRRVVDFGANIGLHSIILSRCGFDVRSFEPDPIHIERFRFNCTLNGVSPDLREAAIGLEDGLAEFVRVKDNTTGSHLSGAKSSPYGALDRFTVSVNAAQEHLEWANLAKIDIEGLEATLITELDPDFWTKTDAVLEIGTQSNAEAIFEHLISSETSMFAQKIGWRRVRNVADLPTSHREGSVFLSGCAAMPWGN